MKVEKIERVNLIGANGVEINPGDIVMYTVNKGKETIFAEFQGFNGGLIQFKPFAGMPKYLVKPSTISELWYVNSVCFTKVEE